MSVTQHIAQVALGRYSQWRDPLTWLPLFIALASLGLVFRDPEMFTVVLTLDLVLLGYHHVVATYFKIGSGAADWHKFGYLLWGVLPAVIVATLLMAQLGGIGRHMR